MRDYDSISEIEMDNKTYAVVENVIAMVKIICC